MQCHVCAMASMYRTHIGVLGERELLGQAESAIRSLGPAPGTAGVEASVGKAQPDVTPALVHRGRQMLERHCVIMACTQAAAPSGHREAGMRHFIEVCCVGVSEQREMDSPLKYAMGLCSAISLPKGVHPSAVVVRSLCCRPDGPQVETAGWWPAGRRGGDSVSPHGQISPSTRNSPARHSMACTACHAMFGLHDAVQTNKQQLCCRFV